MNSVHASIAPVRVAEQVVHAVVGCEIYRIGIEMTDVWPHVRNRPQLVQPHSEYRMEVPGVGMLPRPHEEWAIRCGVHTVTYRCDLPARQLVDCLRDRDRATVASHPELSPVDGPLHVGNRAEYQANSSSRARSDDGENGEIDGGHHPQRTKRSD
jgi:hypothetical protein